MNCMSFFQRAHRNQSSLRKSDRNKAGVTTSPGLQTHCTIRLYTALSPYTVQNIPVFGDPQQLVVSGNLMEISSLFIGKEQIGFPNGVQHGRIKVKGVIGIFAVGQPRVVPLLSQENVHSVILQRTKTAMSTDQRWGRDASTFYKPTSGSGTCEVSQGHACMSKLSPGKFGIVPL